VNIPNITPAVKEIDRAREFQIYKEACSLGASYNMALRAVDLRVIGEILSYLNHRSFSAFPGINTLLSTLPIGRTTLFRSLNKLESEGHIRRQRRWNKSKRKSDSTVYVPLIPDKVMPTLRIRFANQPDALLVLARAGKGSTGAKKQDEQRTKMTLGSTVEMTLGSTVEMTPEPLTEPPTEPLSFTGCDLGSHHRLEDKKEKRVGEEGSALKEERDALPRSDSPSFVPIGSALSGIPRPDPSRSEAYQRARRLFGDRGATIIAMAAQRGVPDDEIRDTIESVVKDGGDVNDLAHMLLHGGEYW
jgi:hypothetical protein